MPSETNPAAPARLTRLAIATGIILAAAAAWCFYWFLHAWPYWEDDAWIHLEFARSLSPISLLEVRHRELVANFAL